jgi:hypothetical protein
MSGTSNIHIVRLMGGLGNQMFQYAFGRRLAMQRGREVFFDVENGFRHDTFGRRFALSEFRTLIARAEPKSVPLGMNWPSPWHLVANGLWRAISGRKQRVIYERNLYRFDEAMLARVDGPNYYFGYWQNEGYFAPIGDLLREEFTVRAQLGEGVLALMREILGCRAISMHVRQYRDVGTRGKIIQKAQYLHGACSADYYDHALKCIGVSADTVCYIFSDNPKWAKTNLRLPVQCRWVADVCRCSDVEEMMLMAACQHHIIANSSFSWWAAWLGSNPEKKIVAPRTWMCEPRVNTTDVCPASWVTV